MRFAPDITETLARARADLRMGVPVILYNDPDNARETPLAALVVAAETVTSARLADLLSLPAPASLAITSRRAETLKARAYDGDLARIPVDNGATLKWVQSIADPADDLNNPLKGPFSCDRSGPADLHRLAIHLTKSARLLPAALVVPIDNPDEFAAKHCLTMVNTRLATPIMTLTSPLHRVINARVPLSVSDAGRLHIFRPEDGGEEHYAVEIGRPNRDEPVLTRLHSACFTGDLLGSMKCDCGPQLRSALAQMGTAGSGVLLYLNQEGRGIGLANKMRAYSLQDQGFDTVEANHRLGFEDDERDFRIGSNILKSMGFSSVRLLTNNPAKIEIMQNNGIDVAERVALKIGENPHNTAYLATKAAKSGHLL